MQIIENTILSGQDTKTSECLGTAPVRHVNFAEIVDVMEVEPPLPDESLPVFMTATVVDSPPYMVEDVQPAPGAESVLPAPVVMYTTLAPVVYDIAPTPAVTYAVQAPVDEHSAQAPAVSYAALTPVVQYMAPTPAVTFAAPTLVSVHPAQQRTLELIVDVPVL